MEKVICFLATAALLYGLGSPSKVCAGTDDPESKSPKSPKSNEEQIFYPSTDKIDSNGHYTRFPGVTIVADIGDDHKEIFREIYQTLSKNSSLTKHYALLPLDSYHMTTNNLYTEFEKGKPKPTWSAEITEKLPFLQRLNSRLHEKTFHPRITLKEVRVRGAMTLEVGLDSDQVSTIHEIAQEFDIKSKIPPFFHISLGYMYKGIPESEQKRLTKEINSEIEAIVSKHGTPEHPNPSITLQEPNLCYFNDMLHFTHWDARHNPFSNENHDVENAISHISPSHPTGQEKTSPPTSASDRSESGKSGMEVNVSSPPASSNGSGTMEAK